MALLQADCEDILLPSPKLSGKLLVSFSGKNIPKHANASMRWFGKSLASVKNEGARRLTNLVRQRTNVVGFVAF